MKLFYNCFIRTMKGELDTAKGMLVNDEGFIEKILYQESEVQDLLFSDISCYDLNKAYLYPGFVDTHTHSFEGGIYENAANLDKAASIDDIFDILTAIEPINEVYVGYHLDENGLKEKRFPTLRELEAVFGDKPCIIRRIDGHSSLINTKTYQLSNLQEYTDSLGTKRKIAPFNGLLNAELNDYVSGWFHKSFGKEGIVKAYRQAALKAVSKGHTTIHTMVGDGKQDLMHYELLADIIQNQPDIFPVEYILYPQVFEVHGAKNTTSGRIGGCLLADGSYGSKTAAVTEAYRHTDNYGKLYKTDEEWYDFIKEAHREELQIAIHCIGDRAIKQIVNIYSKVQEDDPKDLQHQIIHCEMITDDSIIEKMAAYKIAANMQPVFDRLWGGKEGMYADLLGTERALNCNRLNSLISRGVLVTGGSDWYVAELDALKGIDSAVNLHNEKERITAYQAVELYTLNAAKLIKQDDVVGSLEKSKVADFVCLDRDILAGKDISSIDVREVFKKGKKVFDRRDR